MTTEQARAKLILFYGVSDPTSREIALYVLYGEDAPFLQAKEQTQVANITISGGNRMKDLQTVLINLRGAQQLLSLFCSSTRHIEADVNGNPQEALFQIEEMFDKSIKDLERVLQRLEDKQGSQGQLQSYNTSLRVVRSQIRLR